jgi:hypothetical protein
MGKKYAEKMDGDEGTKWIKFGRGDVREQF